jgi:hypothetical protein
MTDSTAPQVDDIVTVDYEPGTLWIIRRVNAKTYSLDQVDADGRPFPECRRIRADRGKVRAAALVKIPAPYAMPAEIPATGATVGMLKAWLRDVPDSMPVLLARDDAGNTHAGLAAHTGAIASPDGRFGFQTALWDGDHQDADLLDLIQAEGGQRVFVLIPQA